MTLCLFLRECITETNLFVLVKNICQSTGLMKKKKLSTWLQRTFFCIKVHSFEMIKIGEKSRFQHPKAYSKTCQKSKMEGLALTIFVKCPILNL